MGEILQRRADGGYQPRDRDGQYDKVGKPPQVIDVHGGGDAIETYADQADPPIKVMDQRDGKTAETGTTVPGSAVEK